MYENQISQSHLTDVLGVAPSTWFESKKLKPEDRRRANKGRPKSVTSKTSAGEVVADLEVISALRTLRARIEFQNGGGYRKMTKYLRRIYGFILNKKKVYRLCSENGLLLQRGTKKIQRRTPISTNRIVTSPFCLWELDIKYGYIHGEKRFFFLMAIIDVYLRYIVGYHIGLRCLGNDLVRTLRLAMTRMGQVGSDQLVIRMDNGPQMKSNAMFKFASENSERLIHELIPVRTPNKDAHIESFYSILETECFQVNVFKRYLDGYRRTAEFIKFYQTERIHSSLQDRTPEECLTLYRQGRLTGIKEVRL